MTVVLQLTDGTRVRLDRNYRLIPIANQINEARGSTQLLQFQNDATPSRVIYVDPNSVVLIQNA